LETSDTKNKICCYCGEEIAADSRRCPYCGSLLDAKAVDESTSAPLNSDNLMHGLNYKNRVQVQAKKQERNTMGNGLKVFITLICALIPGLGQLAGVILGIVLINMEGDSDRNSFGITLLVASLIMFVISCIGGFVLVLTFLTIRG
jgi:hypothetical protein